MYVYRDDEVIASLGASGSAKTLNALLSAAKVPLSRSYDEDAEAARGRVAIAAERRWLEAMPRSLAPFWNQSLQPAGLVSTPQLRQALIREYPRSQQRILALFTWYGSGAGPWSGFPSYEELAETLLLDYTTDELLTTLKGQTLTPSQTEGVARLFGGWSFSQARPGELSKLPNDLKASLLNHSLKSSDPDKIARAKSAFGSEPPNY